MDPKDMKLKQNQNQNQHNESDNSCSPKSPDNPPASPEPKKKIIDLNDDCLLEIFKPFDLRNLFNVAVSSEFLRPAADAVYNRKFRGTKVHINHDEPIEPDNFPLASGPHIVDNQIRVYGFQQCLQYLRFFGSSITRLVIFCRKWTNEQCQHIYQYVNEYCAESLIQIELVGKPHIVIGAMTRPFTHVRSVLIFEHDLSDRLPSFPQWFPNLRALTLNNVRADKRCIAAPFHHLHDLRIDINEGGFRRFKGKEVAALLLKCHRLTSLHIRQYDLQGMTLNTLVNFIKGNQTIRNVNILMEAYSMAVVPSEIERLAMENPSLVAVHLMSYVFTVDTAIKFIEKFDSLKVFRFQIEDQSEYDRLVALLGTAWQSFREYDYWGCKIVTLKR